MKQERLADEKLSDFSLSLTHLILLYIYRTHKTIQRMHIYDKNAEVGIFHKISLFLSLCGLKAEQTGLDQRRSKSQREAERV